MEMPKPSPGHARLELLAGDWEGEETMHPSQWDPAGGKAVGRNRGRISLGGFALINEYEQERDGEITFTGHGVTTYDPKKDEYVMHWLDCMGSPPEVFTGNWDGDVLTLSHGGRMHARAIYDMSTPGEMKSSMDMSQDGENWNRLFDAVYRKA